MREVHFTADQRNAIDIAQRHLDACVVAGPGSGKTTVLVEYFRRLVEQGVDPLRILAITFTEKAAGNMRTKLAVAFQGDPQLRARLERAWVSTVHGFCTRLLRENAIFAGVDPEFYVADAQESWRMQQDSMAKAMDSVFRDHPVGVRALIRGLSSFEFEEAVLSAYDGMRGAGMRVDQLADFPAPAGVAIAAIAETLSAIRAESLTGWNLSQQEQCEIALEGAERIVSAPDARAALQAIEAYSCNLNKCKKGANAAYNLLRRMNALIEESQYGLITTHFEIERRLLLEILSRFDGIYRDRKSQAGALDFSDLEEFAVRLLEDHPETRARLQEQFDHILMDEFQDTNGQQAKLLRLVRTPDRFYAVGDINQSIFGFRHAEPRGFQQYRDEVQSSGRRLVELIDNFRSRPEILSAVETITAGAPGVEPRSLVAGRHFEQQHPFSVEVLAITSDEPVEAACVAQRILQLRSAEPEFEFKDFALLVRNTEVLPTFTAAFDRAGIPYLVSGGRGFYENREVRDLSHLLRVIANPRDEVSLAAVLRSPLAGVSDEALLRLKMTGENLGQALRLLTPQTAAEFDPDDALRLCRFAARLHEWRIRRESVSFDRLLLAAIDDCGYPASPNLDKFLAQSRAASPKMSLDEFIEDLALVRESNPREPDAPPEDSANAVKVMTVHSAKGLEFPIVFLSALHKGVDPGVPVVAFSPRIGLGARWRNPARRKDKDDLYQHAIREERKIRESEESNRLLYVAMTRAEHRLVLSFSTKGRKPKEWAEAVSTSLQLNVDTARDEVVPYTAPDGKPWNLRVLVTAAQPAQASAAPLGLPADPTSESLASLAPSASVEFLAAPELTGQHDANATVTALSQFAKCPREYYLGRYLGFEGRARSVGDAVEDLDADIDLSAGEFGTQVHELLAGTAVANSDPAALRLADVFRQSALGKRAARATRIEREFDFLMEWEGLVVRGQVDLWFEEAGELVLVDYKTDKVTAVEAHQRARDYAIQLRMYAVAVERIAGRPPDRAWLHFLRPNTAIPVDLRPSLLDSPEQLIADFLEAQAKMDFPMHEAGHCRRCQFYQGLCPSTYR